MTRRLKHAPAPLTVSSAWPDTMGLEQAAEYLRLGRDATRDLFDRGELPGVSLNQKHLVFRRVALDRFLADMEVRQAAERLKAARMTLPANDPDHSPRQPPRPDLAAYERDA